MLVGNSKHKTIPDQPTTRQVRVRHLEDPSKLRRNTADPATPTAAAARTMGSTQVELYLFSPRTATIRLPRNIQPA